MPENGGPNYIRIDGTWKLNFFSSLILIASAALNVWFVIPYRVDTVEERLDRIERVQVQWVELLTRIDERVERMSIEQERLRDVQRDEPE